MSEEVFAALVGWLTPPVVSFVKDPRWPVPVKVLLAFVVSLAVATVGSIISGDLTASGLDDVGGWLSAGAIAFSEAQAVYRVLFRGTETGRALEDALRHALWTEESG